MSRFPTFLVAGALVVTAGTCLLPARAEQDPPGTPGLLSQMANEVPEVTEVLTHDGLGEGVKSFGKVCLEEAELLGKTSEKVLDAAGKPGLGGAMREKGLKLYGEGKQAEKLHRAGAGWADKLGRALDTINIVGTVARTAGHLVEGDLPGAVEVVVDEAAKKATTTSMAAAGGVGGPLGSFAGAMAGEELHAKYTRPAIQKEADNWRQSRANERQLSQIPPHQREAALREERRLREQLERAGGQQEGRASDGGVDILSLVSAQRLRATGRKEEDHSSGNIRSVLTSMFTLSFYNVGTMAPGYGKAVLHAKTTGSLSGGESSDICQGLFSGGPDGTFRMICDDSVVELRLVGGQQVTGPEGFRLSVDSPAAFKDWPVKK